jgi:hypothetical protein
MSFGERVVAHIRSDDRRMPVAEVNPLQEALNDYCEMKRERDKAMHDQNEMRVQNGALIAEVNMLRQSLEQSDVDRIRLQSVSSTLLGRLLAINAVIGDAVRDSIRNGIEAVEESRPEEEALDADAARDILERVTLPPNKLAGGAND